MNNRRIRVRPLEIAGVLHQKNASTRTKRCNKSFVFPMFIVVTFMTCYFCCYYIIWIRPIGRDGQNISGASDFLNWVLSDQNQQQTQSRIKDSNATGGGETTILRDDDGDKVPKIKAATTTTTFETNRVDTSNHDDRPNKGSNDNDYNPNNYIPNKDPLLNTTNCHRLLESYRMGEIPQMMLATDEYPIDKSYVRRTKTFKPFYVSVHDEKIDQVRTDLFLNGRYYESKLSRIIQNVFDRKHESSTDATTAATTTHSKNSIMIDVGGNIGWFSLLAAAHGAEVFTFEPNIINMVRFCESQILNGWVSSSTTPMDEQKNRIHSYLKGVSHVHGTLQPMFQISSSNPGSFTFSNESAKLYNVTQQKVEDGMLLPLVTLDALALDQGWLLAAAEEQQEEEVYQAQLQSQSQTKDKKTMSINPTTTTTSSSNNNNNNNNNNNRSMPKPSIGFLKIDVEGLELSVLKGATRLLNSGMVENIAMEFKITMGRRTLIEIVKILFDSGYEAYEIGGWQGPSTTILSGKLVSQYKSAKPFITDLLVKFGDRDANVWFRLAEKNQTTIIS